jgi:hypothetical protein
MTRTSIVLLGCVLASSACKGDTVVKDTPQTLAELETCKRSVDEKDKLIKAEEAENATLMRGSGSGSGGGEIVVSIEGNNMVVKPAAAGVIHPVDDKVALAGSKEFIDVVTKSRGAIQKCYEQALKKRSDLQAHSVTLTVSASFAQSGSYHDSAFAPSLGDVFDQCIKTVASKWTMSASLPPMTYKTQVSLTPS